MITRRAIVGLPFIGLCAAEPLTTIVFGGDVILCRRVADVVRARGGDWTWPMRGIAPILSKADIAFVNLESPFWTKKPIGDNGIIFRCVPEAVKALEFAGIDVVSTANNHARDCYDEGVLYTAELLAKHGIGMAGSGLTAEAAHSGAVVERNGIRFGFLGYTFDQSNGNHSDINPRVAMLDASQMRRDVDAMKKRAQTVVVSMHAGTEYVSQPIPAQIEFAHAAIDAGACMVVGHHPHVIQPIERYKGGVIFYSLGNLVFDQIRKETREGILLEARFRGAKLVSYKTIPVDIVETVPVVSPGRAASEERL